MITRTVIEQFGPFRGRVELPLADQGFVLIKGKNLVSAAADANGVGKTSIAHAIAWCLFGEDLVGRKADAVACSKTKGMCSVRTDMEDGLGKWAVLRTRRPANLIVEGIEGIAENEDMKVIQEKIEQRLGIGIRTFKNAVIFGQGAFDRFANAGQEEQMKMLDEIQGIDFKEPLGKAKGWLADLREKLRLADLERNGAITKIDLLSKNERTLLDLRNTFSQAKARRTQDAQTQVDAALERAAAALEAVKLAGEAALELAEVKPAKAEEDRLFSVLERRQEVLAEAEQQARAAGERYASLRDRLNTLIDQDQCPSCRQPVKARKAKINELFELELTEKLAEARAADGRVASFREAFDKDSIKYGEQMKVVGRLVPEGQNVTKYIASLEFVCSDTAKKQRETAVRTTAQEHLAALAALTQVEGEEWTGSDELVKCQQRLVTERAAQEAVQIRIPKIEQAITMAEYAVEAFGDRGLRSMMADGVSDYLNERSAAHLEILAAGEARQTMSTQTALKKGGAKERISFKREWDWGGSGPLDGSGGQDRRMDLATFAAVQDLSENRSARPFPIKLWDEPGDGLDSRGKELFLQWVAQQARTRGTGLLITHSEDMVAAADPDHVWTVVLDNDGARVEIDS